MKTTPVTTATVTTKKVTWFFCSQPFFLTPKILADTLGIVCLVVKEGVMSTKCETE